MTARRFVALAALLTMTACGVQPTGVVGAGPAPGIPDARTSLAEPNGLILYFLLDGKLHAVARPSPTPESLGLALNELLNGPNDPERAGGATTLLPPFSTPVSVTGTTGSIPTVTVPFAVRRLPPLAISQLVCTAGAVSQWPADSAGINLIGLDGPTGLRQCSG
jgi:hypothetical protein